MEHTEINKKWNSAFGCGPMMMRSARPCRLGFGVMLIIIGTIWLAAEMGWIIPDLFWPAAMLAAGIAVLAFNLAGTGKSRFKDGENKEV